MQPASSMSTSFNVMISSTMYDLKPEREAAHAAIADAKMTPWWAESPPAQFGGLAPRKFCQRMAEQSDLFLLIVGPSYGFTPEKTRPTDAERSVTEMEVAWASAESRRKVFVFIRQDALTTAD